MPNYKAMYYKLAAHVADAIDLLIKAQREGEEYAISDEHVPLLQLADKTESPSK